MSGGQWRERGLGDRAPLPSVCLSGPLASGCSSPLPGLGPSLTVLKNLSTQTQEPQVFLRLSPLLPCPVLCCPRLAPGLSTRPTLRMAPGNLASGAPHLLRAPQGPHITVRYNRGELGRQTVALQGYRSSSQRSPPWASADLPRDHSRQGHRDLCAPCCKATALPDLPAVLATPSASHWGSRAPQALLAITPHSP